MTTSDPKYSVLTPELPKVTSISLGSKVEVLNATFFAFQS